MAYPIGQPTVVACDGVGEKLAPCAIALRKQLCTGRRVVNPARTALETLLKLSRSLANVMDKANEVTKLRRAKLVGKTSGQAGNVLQVFRQRLLGFLTLAFDRVGIQHVDLPPFALLRDLSA